MMLTSLWNHLRALVRGAVSPRPYFAHVAPEALPAPAFGGMLLLMIFAALLILTAALLGAGNFSAAVDEFAARYNLTDNDLPEDIDAPLSLPYEFPLIWAALIVFLGTLRFLFLTILGDRRSFKSTLALACYSSAPLIVVGLSAAVLEYLFPSGGEFHAAQVGRLLVVTAAVIFAWFWEGFVTVTAYGRVFDLFVGRGLLVWLFPWFVLFVGAWLF